MSSEESQNNVNNDLNDKAKKPDELKKSLDEILAAQFSEVEYESASVELNEEDAKVKSELESLPKQTVSTKDPAVPEKRPEAQRKQVLSEQDPLKSSSCKLSGTENPKPKLHKAASDVKVNSKPILKSDSLSDADKIKQLIYGADKPTEKKQVSALPDVNIPSQKVNTSNVAVIYSEKHTNHSSIKLGMESPERPERLVEAMVYLKKNKIFDNSRCDLITEFDEATEERLLNVHTPDYVEFIKSYAAKGGGFLGDSTYITPESYGLARLAAGGAIKAADVVLSGDYSYAFALIRPPGHHASADKYGGFCLFNNAAILARYLQKEKHINKVLILDWDAHAGNGTMDIFYSDPTVMTISIHRDPHEFYPRTGFTTQTGNGAGRGYNVNIEMPVGCGDEEYKLAFDEVLLPLIERFSPNFVICCCGFDGHYKEHNTKLKLTSEGYYQMMNDVSSVVHGNLVLLAEGGYHKFNGQLSHSVINALLGKPNPIDDLPSMSNYERHTQKKIFKEAERKISDVKKLFSII